MSHDRCCPLNNLPGLDCAICQAIERARGQEKQAFNEAWKANLPLIEQRSYAQGYADGAAGHPPRYE